VLVQQYTTTSKLHFSTREKNPNGKIQQQNNGQLKSDKVDFGIFWHFLALKNAHLVCTFSH